MDCMRLDGLRKSKKWHPDMHAASPPHCAACQSSHAEFRIIKVCFYLTECIH